MTVPGTPTWLRTRNDRTAFRLLLEHGPLSRTRLGELTGLSKPTAGQMMMRLERIGLVAAVGEITGQRGPNAISYGVRSDSMTGVAINVMANTIESVLVDPTDQAHPVAVMNLLECMAEGDERSAVADVEAAVRAACEEAGADISTVSIVAVGVQGSVDPTLDELWFTEALPGWPLRGARRQIEHATGYEVILENDANLAAAAARSIGTARDAASFAYVWLGEGVGVGVVVDGVVQRGASGAAGELGYLEVPRSAAAIDPHAVDFTDLLSADTIRRLRGLGPDAPLADVLAGLSEDEDLLADLAHRVALLVAPLLAVLDPPVIVLGGPTGHAGGGVLAALVQARIATTAYPKADPAKGPTHRPVSVRPAQSPSPVLEGARQLLVSEIRDRLEASIAESVNALG